MAKQRHSRMARTRGQRMSYHQIIMQKLNAGETISPLSALNDFGCLSLPQRISELRQAGEPIKGRLVSLPNGKRHNIYWIEPQDRKPHKT